MIYNLIMNVLSDDFYKYDNLKFHFVFGDGAYFSGYWKSNCFASDGLRFVVEDGHIGNIDGFDPRSKNYCYVDLLGLDSHVHDLSFGIEDYDLEEFVFHADIDGSIWEYIYVV